MKNIQSFVQNSILLIGLIAILSACEEPIKIDLIEADKQVVIEGVVSDSDSIQWVRLTWTQAYHDLNSPPPVEGAKIWLSDASGMRVALNEMWPGYFETDAFVGKLGETYSMEVAVGTDTFRASEKMFSGGRLDSFRYDYFENASILPDTGYYISFYAQDNPDERNFYITQIFQNDTLYDEGLFPFMVFDDRFSQGQYINGFLVPFPLDSGAVIRLVSSSITEEAFDYYFGLIQQQNSGGPFGAPPANLQGNISGGALGYFRVSAIRRLEGKMIGKFGVVR